MRIDIANINLRDFQADMIHTHIYIPKYDIANKEIYLDAYNCVGIQANGKALTSYIMQLRKLIVYLSQYQSGQINNLVFFVAIENQNFKMYNSVYSASRTKDYIIKFAVPIRNNKVLDLVHFVYQKSQIQNYVYSFIPSVSAFFYIKDGKHYILKKDMCVDFKDTLLDYEIKFIVSKKQMYIISETDNMAYTLIYNSPFTSAIYRTAKRGD